MLCVGLAKKGGNTTLEAGRICWLIDSTIMNSWSTALIGISTVHQLRAVSAHLRAAPGCQPDEPPNSDQAVQQRS